MHQKFFLIVILSLHFAINSEMKAQEGWFWQHPSPTGNTLQAISFCDDNNGIAVGFYGTIIRTTNGGDNWTLQESGTMEILRDVSFVDPNNGTVVGEHGLILNTKDSGQTWNKQSSGTTETLYGVSFSDANTGTAVGVMGTILRTTDGGNNWIFQESSLTGWFGALLDVCFIDANNGTLVGSDGTLHHTTDGGQTWVAQNSGTTKSLSGISFLDLNNGIAVGSGGTVIITNNGGETWTQLQITENNLHDVSFTDINNCLIAGNNNTVIRITGAGSEWTRYYQVGEGDFYGASHNTVVGESGQIFRTTDEGETWDAQRTGPVRTLKGVCFTSQDIGTAVGLNGTILRTINGGNTWETQTYESPSFSGSINDYLKAVSFSDDNNGFIVSGNSYDDGSIPSSLQDGLILRTTNGGATWNDKYNNDRAAFNGVSSPSTNTCFAVGVYEILEDGEYVDHAGWASTTDGGAEWRNRYFTSITDPLTDVSFINNNTGILVGYNGRIMLTTNGGYNWYTKPSETTKNLHGVCFTDKNTCTVVGEDGTILRTLDGGNKWLTQTSGTSSDLYGVCFVDANNGKIIGSNGTVLHTTNGGNTWEMQTVCTDEDLYAVSFSDVNTGNVVGKNGTILRTINSGITSVFDEKDDEIPQGYILSQNYPNPFNPVTKIKYSIPPTKDGFITLKVYDILGREVATLVDEEQKTGTYQINFDAANLASGIYFYCLKADDFISTKKMILLK